MRLSRSSRVSRFDKLKQQERHTHKIEHLNKDNRTSLHARTKLAETGLPTIQSEYDTFPLGVDNETRKTDFANPETSATQDIKLLTFTSLCIQCIFKKFFSHRKFNFRQFLQLVPINKRSYDLHNIYYTL